MESTYLKYKLKNLLINNKLYNKINYTKVPYRHLAAIYVIKSLEKIFDYKIKFNFDNLNKSETSFNLKERFDLIFNLLDVKDISNFNSKIALIKKQAKLEDNLVTLNINISQSSERIIKGINLLRLGNNPVKIDESIIFNIISKQKPSIY